MKTTLANNKQLFNVKALATAGLTIGQIPVNTLGLVSEATGLTVAANSLVSVPFTIVSNVNGKIYSSFTTIDPSKMIRKSSKDYVAQVPNIWEALIKDCKCIDLIQLIINIQSANFIQQDGFNNKSDVLVEVASPELKCFCDCTGQFPVYENHVFTTLLASKINAAQSGFYEAYVRLDITGITTGSTAPTGGSDGDFYIRTGSTDPGLYMKQGGSWAAGTAIIGDVNGILTNPTSFMNYWKTANTTTGGTPSPMVYLGIKGIIQTAPAYQDVEGNYVYPRGVKLAPVITIDGKNVVTFVETQALTYEIGAGYDMRAEEFDNMTYYDNYDGNTHVSGKFQNPDLIYQFENFKNYKTISFEYMTDTTLTNDGNSRLFGVVIGVEDDTMWTNLKTALGV